MKQTPFLFADKIFPVFPKTWFGPSFYPSNGSFSHVAATGGVNLRTSYLVLLGRSRTRDWPACHNTPVKHFSFYSLNHNFIHRYSLLLVHHNSRALFFLLGLGRYWLAGWHSQYRISGSEGYLYVVFLEYRSLGFKFRLAVWVRSSAWHPCVYLDGFVRSLRCEGSAELW